MATIMSKRFSTTLYSDPKDHYCHRVRFVLAEKDVEVEIESVDPSDKTHEVYDINAAGHLPTLLDRDLVLHHSVVIMEYLEERFPHPPLFPSYPSDRVPLRLLMYQKGKLWYECADALLAGKGPQSKLDKLRKVLAEEMACMALDFSGHTFYMNEEITLADCYLAPLLWRLPLMNLQIPQRQMKEIDTYAERIFERKAFQDSLSEVEKSMRS